MADLLIRIYPTDTSLKIHSQPSCSCFNTLVKRFRSSGRVVWAAPNNKESPHFVCSENRKLFLVPTCSVSSSTSTARGVGNNKQSSYEESESQSVWSVEDNANYFDGKRDNEVEYLANDFGWKVRRLANNGEEIRNASRLQAKAFHEPTFLFDDFFFRFFQAEVLAALIYKLKNSPPDRYACMVAEAETSDISKLEQEQLLVGVADVTALRDQNVLHNLPPDAHEYLYISGIAVSEKFRRKKIATVLLKACDVLSILWGFKYLVLRAYENDHGARELYSNAGYRVVSGDPPWFTTWIGRKRRVLMIKQLNQPSYKEP